MDLVFNGANVRGVTLLWPEISSKRMETWQFSLDGHILIFFSSNISGYIIPIIVYISFFAKESDSYMHQLFFLVFVLLTYLNQFIYQLIMDFYQFINA